MVHEFEAVSLLVVLQLLSDLGIIDTVGERLRGHLRDQLLPWTDRTLGSSFEVRLELLRKVLAPLCVLVVEVRIGWGRDAEAEQLLALTQEDVVDAVSSPVVVKVGLARCTRHQGSSAGRKDDAAGVRISETGSFVHGVESTIVIGVLGIEALVCEAWGWPMRWAWATSKKTMFHHRFLRACASSMRIPDQCSGSRCRPAAWARRVVNAKHVPANWRLSSLRCQMPRSKDALVRSMGAWKALDQAEDRRSEVRRCSGPQR